MAIGRSNLTMWENVARLFNATNGSTHEKNATYTYSYVHISIILANNTVASYITIQYVYVAMWLTIYVTRPAKMD